MKNLPVVIIGGGGHTRVLIGMLQRAGIAIAGIITSNEALLGTAMMGVQVLGLQKDFAMMPSEVTLVNGVGNRANRGGAMLDARADIYHYYRAQGFNFLPVVSGDAIIQPEVIMGDGVQIMPGAVIQPGAMIGENVIINTRASIDHDVIIYPHSHIAPGAVVCGQVVIGEETHIGAGAVVIQGMRIGSNVVIGAGAVVNRHVPDNALVRPSPSEQICVEPLVRTE